MALFNPKNQKQKVAFGKINNHGGGWGGGGDKYHHHNIPYFHFKVNVSILYYLNVLLMHPHEPVDQYKLSDLINSCTLWNWKYVKKED